jgi:hypothetical protein
MLSLIGKVAAGYAQSFDDAVAIGAVNEIEDLTTGLARKIWQKMIVLHGAPVLERGGTAAAPPDASGA